MLWHTEAIETASGASLTRIYFVPGGMKPWMLQRHVGSGLQIQEVEANTKLRVGVRSVLIFAGNILRILVLLIASSFGPLGVEQTETIGNYRLLRFLFGSHRLWHERLRPTLREGNITFVIKEPDPAALVLHPRHHAGAGERGVADRVGVDVGVTSMELDVDDDKIRDVFHVFTDALLCQAFRSSVVDQDIASDATRNLVVDVVLDPELMFSPADFDLTMRY